MMPTELYPWQGSAWQGLQTRHSHGGLPHALMLTGPAGIGKHTLALTIARWLLCQRPSGAGACGTCHSCLLWKAGNHPDFQEARPEDGSRQIRIDTVRKLNEFLNQTPQISRCQVVILHPAEVLNVNAANALLKTLEEPPGESFIILEAERTGAVMPTIRSRCQMVALLPPALDDGVAWLGARGHGEHDARQALQHNGQAPLAAEAWLASNSHRRHQDWLNLLVQWLARDIRLDAVIQAWKSDEADAIVLWMMQILSDLLKCCLGADNGQLLEPQVRGLLVAATLDRTKLIALHDRMAEITARMQSGASHYNRQLLLESLLIDWRALFVKGDMNGQHGA